MHAIERLIAADRQTRKRIAVVGDAMIDRWITGDIHGCQDGCPKFVKRFSTQTPGGAANALEQLRNWNCERFLIARTGYSDSGADYELSFRDGNTIVKERYLVDGKIAYRVDDDSTMFGQLYPEKVAEQRRLAISSVRRMNFDAVLISDYMKGFLDEATIDTIIDICMEQDIPVVADGKREPKCYNGAILKVNADYARQHMREVQRHTPVAIITQGCGQPCLAGYSAPVACYADGCDLPPVHCLNHVGAGDCFAATLTLALAHGLKLEDAVACAHSAGRVFVQRPYARAPWPHEIRRDLLGVEGKVVGKDELNALRVSLGCTGVVFTNGVFRLPHAGHAWLLEWAKRQAGGAPLVVGINSDESARAVKNPGDFILPIAERVRIISGLACVDWVVVYDEGTPCEVIRELKPATLVKGWEYRDQKVPGHDQVERVVFAPESPFAQHASTIIESIRRGSS